MPGAAPYEEVTHLCMKLQYTSATRHRVFGVINPLQQSVADVRVSLSGTQLTTRAFSFVEILLLNFTFKSRCFFFGFFLTRPG